MMDCEYWDLGAKLTMVLMGCEDVKAQRRRDIQRECCDGGS